VELPGRVLASATAEIRPQVNGIVREKVFQEGSELRAGDVLYRLEANTFQATRDAAAATLQGAEAVLAGAQARYDRVQQLAESKTASAQALDDARVALLQARAAVASATAALEATRINLDNTVITAPIPGIIGTSAVSVGSLVTANQQDALATIRQIDPVNVDLMDTAANRLRLRAQVQAGTIGRDRERRPTVRLIIEDGSTYDETGTVSLTEIPVSKTTGSFALRASFSNPRRILRPGMFVRATVHIGSTPGALLVPQRAVTRNAAGEATAFFVTNDNKAEARVLAIGRAVGSDWLVTGGVAEGDRVIVDGLQRISHGSPVRPVSVEIDSDGVVRQKIATPQTGSDARSAGGAKQ
jgi:membrane fusion protein (multidrug efflux system)